ncbi:hypothetical protein PIB30_062405 [Stylosanthes scabra]|uniref:Uncharacterized protein n=1 Tax=Stylosanthes scabra TaxID=79078 RepID=A0ABU6RLC6_9FABA|nr:hypothetical protein [Stylosanthes scabra]
MSHFPLLSIHYDGEIIRVEDGSVIFRSRNPIFVYLPSEVRCLSTLKNLILNVTGQQDKLIRFSLRTDEEVDLEIYWHIHHLDIHLLELFAILIDVAERSSSSNALNTQSTDLARGLNNGMMIDLNIIPDRSINALNSTQNMSLRDSIEDEVESHQRAATPSNPTDESFFVDPILSDEEIDPDALFEQEAAAMNYFTGSSIAFTQPAISERYDCPTHLSSLNLDSMNEQVSHIQRAPDDDPTTEFEVGE